MKLPRRQFLHLGASAAALPAFSRIASAQTYPTRPVRIIVGFPAGGPNDFHARLMGQWLSDRLGQQFVVENRPGAGGNIGTEAVVRAPPDGYTLLLTSSPDAINATLYDNLTFNFVRDIVPVGGIIRNCLVVEVNPSFSVPAIPELIAYAKANPGKISVASGGNGSPQHVASELFKMMTGVSMIHVPYRGEAPALTDLIGGQVQVLFGTITTSLSHIRAGALRALAVTSAVRSEALPDLPTVNNFVPGYEVSTWAGIGAPRGTPPDIIERLNREINAGLESSGIKGRYADMGATAFAGSPAEFGKFIAEDTEKWAKVIRAANIKVG
jgi:tripartite-type tricarboxylate transporter receptor subunit TctC